jgi:hypothetical protein
MRYCKSCDIEIPSARLKLLPNTQYCVKCSDESKWTAVHVIHHKTGNEIEVVKNPDTAKQFKKMSTRATYGAVRGLNSKGSMQMPFKSVGVLVHADEARFNKIGERAMELNELCGFDKAYKYVREFVDLRVLSEGQSKKILRAIEAINNPTESVPEVKVVNKYNPYGKNEPKKSKPTVSDDIMYVFHNWKR